ncbi:hypothetical protein L5F24_07550 [Aliarcobacter butzleri]|nr:hypothetical protein [Aliarcobacter butzleri]MCG3667856.1 hypothetical protein [Aliarcobacter butzleri]
MINYLNEEAVEKAKAEQEDKTEQNASQGCGPGDCSPVNGCNPDWE